MSAEKDAGLAALQVGRPAEAIPYLEQAVSTTPQDLQILFALSAAYGQTGRHSDAVRTMLQAVALQPSHAEARYLLAIAYDNAGYRDHALTSAQQALQLMPDYPAASALVARLAGAAQPPLVSSPLPTGSYTPPHVGVLPPPDKFDMRQAARDWVRVVREPHAFFEEQGERNGLNAPLAFLITYGVAVGLCTILSGLIRLIMAPSDFLNIVLEIFFGATHGITGALIGALIWGGCLHLFGRMFGNRQPYQRTFRVAAYSRAPMLFFLALSALIGPLLTPPSQPLFPFGGTTSPSGQLSRVQYTVPSTGGNASSGNSSDGYASNGGPSTVGSVAPLFDPAQIRKWVRDWIPFFLVTGSLSLIGQIWVWRLQAIGLRYAQQLSPSGGVSTVLAAVMIPTLLFLIVFGLLALFIYFLVSAGRQGPPGLIGSLVSLTGMVRYGF